ncbi:MAG: hypothetical protein KDB79_16415 [Acidobacteria bacterium]|nr:hypothetical protein [Acidobacteriota bacterium]
MLDGWNNAGRPLLEEAARDLFKTEGKQGWRDNINELLLQLRTDPERRWKFAPFMLRVMWNALVATNPTSAQEQFRKKCEKWAACDETKVAKMTLADWNNYTGKTRDIGGKFWFGERKPYTQNGLFIPRKRTTEGFLPL